MGLLQQQQIVGERRARERLALIETPVSTLWRADGVGATAESVVQDGSSDVTAVGIWLYVVHAVSGGDATAGTVSLAPLGTFNLYDDGTDVLTLAVAADGSVTVQRTAGADTFDVALLGVWR